MQPNRRDSSVFVRSSDPFTPTLELKVAVIDMPDRLVQFVPAVLRIPASGTEEFEANAFLKVEQWQNKRTVRFNDFQFKMSDGVLRVEPSSEEGQAARPLVWNETPVTPSSGTFTAELLDRTVTLIPVRLRIKPPVSESTIREYVRVDMGSPVADTSAILALEISLRK